MTSYISTGVLSDGVMSGYLPVQFSYCRVSVCIALLQNTNRATRDVAFTHLQVTTSSNYFIVHVASITWRRATACWLLTAAACVRNFEDFVADDFYGLQ